MADHPRRRRVLRRHQAHPQRAPGGARRPHRGAAPDVPALPAAERRAVPRRVRLRDRPRPAAGGDGRARRRVGGEVDLALPHRPLEPEPRGAGLPAPLDPSLRRGDLPSRGLRPRGRGPPGCLHLAAGDRPARAQEHGPLAGGRRLHRRPVRRGRDAAAADPGVALRPVEGPARRDRRVPARQGAPPRHPARARGLDGARRPGGLGLLQPDRRPRGRRLGHLHPLQPQQRRLGGGQRLPGALGRGDPEVRPRGVRPHRLRGAVEGAADGGGAGGRDRRPDRRRRPAGSSTPRKTARGRAPRSWTTRAARASGPCAARSTSAATTSCRGCSATGSRSSTGSPAPGPRTSSW